MKFGFFTTCLGSIGQIWNKKVGKSRKKFFNSKVELGIKFWPKFKPGFKFKKMIIEGLIKPGFKNFKPGFKISKPGFKKMIIEGLVKPGFNLNPGLKFTVIKPGFS